jgi:NADPH:quinone reductase-like Zn-dependent oxidoreductase
MCYAKRPGANERWHQSISAPNTIAYKVLQIKGGRLVSPTRSYNWKPGLNKAKSEHGIYVFINYYNAQDFVDSRQNSRPGESFVIVPVTISKRQLLGYSTNGKMASLKQIRITITNWNAAVRSGMRQRSHSSHLRQLAKLLK